MKTRTTEKTGHLMFLTVFLLATAVLNTSGWAWAQEELKFKPYWQITYDGYLQQEIFEGTEHIVRADTLITVNNPGTTSMALWIRVYDKHGELVTEGMLHNSKGYRLTAPSKGYLWVTLGMIVPRSTMDPFGNSLSGEKFQFTIFIGPNPTELKPYRPAKPIVEVKQVIYRDDLNPIPPEKAIWKSSYIKTWAETSLTVPAKRSTVVIPIKQLLLK